MKPVSPVCPYRQLPETEFAKNQPPYKTLPAYRELDGTVVTRWQLSAWERIKVLFTGNLWLTILTFNHPLQPVRLETKCPIVSEDMQHEEV